VSAKLGTASQVNERLRRRIQLRRNEQLRQRIHQRRPPTRVLRDPWAAWPDEPRYRGVTTHDAE
jgi:hypothetical protein